MQIAPAGPEHDDGIRAIAASYGNLEDWARPDWLDFQLDAGALWVALSRGAVTGFAGVVRHAGVAHLADLFIARDRLGRGIGGQLLDAAFAPGTGVRLTFASGDERALPLYVRGGLRPIAPLLYLEGHLPAGGEVQRVPVAGVGAADAAASGRARPDVLGFLGEAGAYALTGENPGSYAVVRPTPSGARIGPAAGGAADVLAFAAAVAAAHGTAQLALFGPHPALAPLLAAGLRVVAADTYMATTLDALDLEAYVPDVDLG
jgi:GNAT superfamily N-acetyltransferase